MPAALVLAAGCSSRAPGFKPLLPLGGATVVETAIGGLRRAGVADITVVAGHCATDLLAVLERLPVRCVVNERYRDGMFASVVAGVQALPAEATSFFLLPADIPLVRSHTIRLLARAGRKTGAAIVYPVFRGQRGHPPLISARLAPAILSWKGEGGLRSLLARHEAAAHEVAVPDEGIMLDIDTAADYGLIVGRHAGRHIPGGSECDAILAKLAAADAVRRHGLVVAAVARRIAARLNRAGLALDEGLVAAAGALHDLAKGRPDHARRGARLLRALGYPKVAALVAVHHDIAFPAGQPPALGEAAIVYLADKLVRSERIVPLDERLERARAEFAGDPEAMLAAAGRLEKARRIAAQAELTLGATLWDIIAGEFGRQAAGERG
jgi:molybdenum cofactor cytidylyltransferase